MDRLTLFDLIYALAAVGGREELLFGDCAEGMREAFLRSLTPTAFPELWFELPLAGAPWCDLHALVSYTDLAGSDATFAGHGGAYADALTWFVGQEPRTVRQLAMSYDVSSGDVDHPAVQLLLGGSYLKVAQEFLKAAGRADATADYQAFIERMPSGWYACYVGVFPSRETGDVAPWVRVECIVGDELQRAYATDEALLRSYLAQVGIEQLSPSLVAGVQLLARTPFPLEFQFNVGAEGKALPVLSASVRFEPTDWTRPERTQRIAQLAMCLEREGLVDGRWKDLAGTAFAKHVTHGDETAQLYCHPAFVKVRWREGEPPDVKAYLIAGMSEGDAQ